VKSTATFLQEARGSEPQFARMRPHLVGTLPTMLSVVRKRVVVVIEGGWWFLVVGLAATWGCVGPVADLYPPAAGEATIPVWVVNHGWHTGLAVPARGVPCQLRPEPDRDPRAEYVEVGWGQRDFYQAHEPTSGLAVRAAVWPAASALHVAAFDRPPTEAFPTAEIVEIDLSPRGFEQLCSFVMHAYARDEHGQPVPLGPGLYGDGQFYLGRESYFLTTCNVWTARALRSAGLPISPAYAVTAGNIVFQVKRLGRSAGPE